MPSGLRKVTDDMKPMIHKDRAGIVSSGENKAHKSAPSAPKDRPPKLELLIGRNNGNDGGGGDGGGREDSGGDGGGSDGDGRDTNKDGIDVELEKLECLMKYNYFLFFTLKFDMFAKSTR
nr:cyclase-associated protein 1-like [Tanacetum cinerariifolium]